MEYKPCLDPHQQSSNYAQSFYVAEIMQATCQPEYNTGKTFDDRYTEFEAWSTDEYTVQKENGVLNLLQGLANFAGSVRDPEVKRQNQYHLWGRPTIGWDLTCEKNGFTRE